jgi:hypothetical protein
MKAQIRKAVRMVAGWPIIGRFVRVAVAVIRMPEFRDECMDLSRRHYRLEQALSELSRHQHILESEKLPGLVQTLSEINRQLTDAYLDLNHRQHILETEKLPALLHDSDNLVKSVPIALRKITRDLIGVKANLESLSKALERAGLVEREVIGLASRNAIHSDLEIKAIQSSNLK